MLGVADGGLSHQAKFIIRELSVLQFNLIPDALYPDVELDPPG